MGTSVVYRDMQGNEITGERREFWVAVNYSGIILGRPSEQEIRTLGCPDNVPRLADALHNSADSRLRAYAAMWLASIGNAGAVECLKSVLGDSDAYVRITAKKGLLSLNDAGAIDALVLELGDSFTETGCMAAIALCGVGNESGISYTKNFLKTFNEGAAPAPAHSASYVYVELALALDRAGAEDALPFLLNAPHHDKRTVSAILARSEEAGIRLLAERIFAYSNVYPERIYVDMLTGVLGKEQVDLLQVASGLRDSSGLVPSKEERLEAVGRLGEADDPRIALALQAVSGLLVRSISRLRAELDETGAVLSAAENASGRLAKANPHEGKDSFLPGTVRGAPSTANAGPVTRRQPIR